MSTMLAVAMLLLSFACTGALRLPGVAERRQVLRLGAAAIVAAPLASAPPAFARSKRPEAQNTKLDAQDFGGTIGDRKGTRGVPIKDFDKNDTVDKNRKVNGGLARDETGRKVVVANRNRDPAELGLKQWDGK